MFLNEFDIDDTFKDALSVSITEMKTCLSNNKIEQKRKIIFKSSY